jgi:hypothetical protein
MATISGYVLYRTTIAHVVASTPAPAPFTISLYLFYLLFYLLSYYVIPASGVCLVPAKLASSIVLRAFCPRINGIYTFSSLESLPLHHPPCR